MRKLIDAGLHTEVDEDTVRDAKDRIEAVTEMLERKQRTRRRRCDMRAPGGQWRGPIPLSGCAMRSRRRWSIHHEDDGRCWSEFTLSGAYEGPPGWVHGGICALVLDHLLGEAASEGLTSRSSPAPSRCDICAARRWGRCARRPFIERTEGVKTFARGYLSDADGTTVEAEGVFIRPAWARDAG